MPTNKPQFNVYLDSQIEKEIAAYSQKYGAKKGKLVETMWRFFNLRDLDTLHHKLAIKLLDGVDAKERELLTKISNLLLSHLQK